MGQTKVGQMFHIKSSKKCLTCKLAKPVGHIICRPLAAIVVAIVKNYLAHPLS